MKYIRLFQLFSLMLFSSKLLCQSKVVSLTWYDLSRENIKEIFYYEKLSSSDTINTIDGNNSLDFFYLYPEKKGDRYKRFDEKGRLVLEVIVDSISKVDPRAYFSEVFYQSFPDTGVVTKRFQRNMLQENWKFYSYVENKPFLIKERLIEYYTQKDGTLKAKALEIDHSAAISDNLMSVLNIDQLFNLNGLITEYFPKSILENSSNYSPNVSWQGEKINGELRGKSFQFYPYNGELGKITTYRKGKKYRIECINYVKDDFGRYKRIIIPINKRGIKSKKRSITCQCDQYYFERGNDYYNQTEQKNPILDRLVE